MAVVNDVTRTKHHDVPSDGGDLQISDHCRSMREAASHCIEAFSTYPWSSFADFIALRSDDFNEDPFSSLLEVRRENYSKFWDNVVRSDGSTYENDGSVIRQLHMKDLSTASEFRRQFHDCNLPCLITGGFDERNHSDTSLAGSWFRRVSQEWRILGNYSDSKVNRDWFVNMLGANSEVPLRVEPICHSPLRSVRNEKSSEPRLDEEGRAEECQTKTVAMEEWITMLQDMESSQTPEDETSPDHEVSYYLKDWHFQSKFREMGHVSNSSTDELPIESLYEVPAVFSYDILNNFLTRFTAGDYKFVYWGPKNSFTSRHSDVLHSFSWSYNVVGTKRWTFFDGSSDRQFSIIQRAGQAMFVPSKWQHHVVNLEETISINHNWITTANLDMCWDCLAVEMRAIQKELDDWGIDDIEAHESMLRGCVGLDVTSFFLMVVVRLVHFLIEKNEGKCYTDDECFDTVSDVIRLTQIVRLLRLDESLRLESRLESTLQSRSTATELLSFVDRIIENKQ